MDTPYGRILSIHQDATPPHVVVKVVTTLRCARCAAGKGCGAGLLGGDEKERRVDALIAPHLQQTELMAGERVALDLAPNNLLRASFIVYGWPLLGAVTGAAAAWRLGLGDPGAALAALAGLGGGMLAGRIRLGRAGCLRAFTPVVTARMGPDG